MKFMMPVIVLLVSFQANAGFLNITNRGMADTSRIIQVNSGDPKGVGPSLRITSEGIDKVMRSCIVTKDLAKANGFSFGELILVLRLPSTTFDCRLESENPLANPVAQSFSIGVN